MRNVLFVVTSLQFPVAAIISLVTVVVYTGVSIRLSFAKKQIIDEDQKADQILKPKKIGWFTKLFPHVSKYAWSTIDLKNLYVSLKYSLIR